MNSKKAYKGVDKYGYASMDEWRKKAIAWSHKYLYGLQNDKNFSYERLKVINDFDKHSGKSDYHTVCLTRENETDRMKKTRRIGSKKLRRYLKNESKRIIEEDLNS